MMGPSPFFGSVPADPAPGWVSSGPGPAFWPDAWAFLYSSALAACMVVFSFVVLLLLTRLRQRPNPVAP